MEKEVSCCHCSAPPPVQTQYAFSPLALVRLLMNFSPTVSKYSGKLRLNDNLSPECGVE